MATYWENSCSFGLRYVSWYKYLIVSLVFSHLGFWSGNLFLIAPFPDLCLLVPFYRYYKRLSSFLNIKTITRIYFKYKTSFSRVFFLLSTYATIPCKRKYQGYYAFHLAFVSCNHLPNSLRPSNFISRF